jgi:hypothetical protein
MSSVTALCPSCAAPVSVSAYSCAFCDHQIRERPVASADADTGRATSRAAAGVLKSLAIGAAKRLAIMAVVLGVLVGGLIAGSVGWLTARLRHHGAESARATTAALARRTPDESWPAFHALAARSARVPGAAAATAAPDEEAARLLATSTISEKRLRSAPWAIDSAALARWGMNQPVNAGGYRAQRAIKAMPGALPDSVMRALAADTLTPWLAAWRRSARSAPFAPLWMYQPGFPGVTDPYALAVPGFAAVKGLAWRNAASGVLALTRGDTATAVLRARENIAVGMHFVREPMLIEHLIGRVLVREGAVMLAEIGRVAGDSALVREGAGLDTAAKYHALPVQMSMLGWGAMAGDAERPAALRFMSDTTLPPSVRAYVAETVPMGACQNTREVLFGFDARRVDATARETARVAAEAPGVARMAELSLRGARAWVEDAAGATAALRRANRSRRPNAIRALERMGLDGVAGRLTICGYMMGVLR